MPMINRIILSLLVATVTGGCMFAPDGSSIQDPGGADYEQRKGQCETFNLLMFKRALDELNDTCPTLLTRVQAAGAGSTAQTQEECESIQRTRIRFHFLAHHRCPNSPF